MIHNGRVPIVQVISGTNKKHYGSGKNVCGLTKLREMLKINFIVGIQNATKDIG